MARVKTTGVYFKMSSEELELFEKRMVQTGIKNKSAFIRKMCIDGHVIKFDTSALTEIGKLLRITANNINQIAHCVNSGGAAYRSDVEEMNRQLTAIRKSFGEVLEYLSTLDNAKPGKRFIPPPKITDFPEGA
jgi:ATP-dependent helicase/DNAse subunit B